MCNKETEIALIKAKQDQHEKLLIEIRDAVVGTESSPGMKTRVDRIEQRHENTWAITKIGMTFITILISILAFIKK
jgi:hypothetical protein